MRTNRLNLTFATLVAATFALAFLPVVTTTPAQNKSSQKDGRGMDLAQASPAVKELPGRTKRFALVIGVDRYADTQITGLDGSSNDARLLAQALTKNAGFPADQVVLLASDQPAERQPTRGNILRRLSNLGTVVPPDGLFLFSFAGHGMERGGQAFLLPSDAQLSDDVSLLEQTAINVINVKNWIQKTNVKQVLMILDACRNDPSGRANADNVLTPSFTRGFSFDARNREVTAFATLYATAVGKRAYEYKEKRHGYFTWALVEALGGAAANSKGEVTLGSLVRYVQERVPKQVLIDLGSGKEQKPFATIEGYKADELVVASAAAGRGKGNETQAKADVETKRPPRESSEPRSTIGEGLEGSTWTGMNENGEYLIEFLKEGKLRYTLMSNKRPVPGTWKQVSHLVQIVIGGYSEAQGTVENGVMRLEGSNREGVKFRMLLTPKTQ
jgi:hypothetical protein